MRSRNIERVEEKIDGLTASADRQKAQPTGEEVQITVTALCELTLRTVIVMDNTLQGQEIRECGEFGRQQRWCS